MPDGPRPPVLLLHGFGADHRMWQATGWLRALDAAGHSVVAPDLPGHGRAAKPVDPAAYAPVEIVNAILSAVGAPVVDVLGYSMGAQVGLELAARYPSRVRRLVLGGAGLKRAVSVDDVAALRRDVDDGVPLPDGPVRRLWQVATMTPGHDAEALLACLAGVAGAPTIEWFPPNMPPALLFAGEADEIAADADVLAERLPSAELMWLDGRDHQTALSAQAAKRAAIAFLAAADQPPRPRATA
jgi:pimeloyl-ACP methyl ester carboxylesterase